MARPVSALTIVLALTLSACGGKGAENELDARIAGKDGADPALTAALEDQIMVDPSLSSQANEDAIRPAPKPNQTPVPAGEGNALPANAAQPQPTLGSLAAEQAEIARDAFNGCALGVEYSADYAARLPIDLPLFPKAQVIEAAGSNENGCKLRAVSHRAPAALKAVAAHYSASAARAGYKVAAKAEGQGQMISGRRAADGAAFYVILTPVAGGTNADLVVNNGS